MEIYLMRMVGTAILVLVFIGIGKAFKALKN